MDKYLDRLSYFSNEDDICVRFHSLEGMKYMLDIYTDVNVNLSDDMVYFRDGWWCHWNGMRWSREQQKDPDYYGLPSDTNASLGVIRFNNMTKPLLKPFRSDRYLRYLEGSKTMARSLLDDKRWVLHTFETIIFSITLFYLRGGITFPLEMIDKILYYLRPLYFIPEHTLDDNLNYSFDGISHDRLRGIIYDSRQGISTWEISHYQWRNTYSREKECILTILFSLKRILKDEYSARIGETLLKCFKKIDFEPRMGMVQKWFDDRKID